MRIDLLVSDRKKYTFEGYVMTRVKQVFMEREIPFQEIYLSDGLLTEYLSYRKKNPPSWSMSFSALFPVDRSLADLLPGPHFTWMRGSESSLLPTFSRSSAKWGIPDKKIFDELSSPNLLHLPLGVEHGSNASSRPFPVVFFGPVVDLSRLHMQWEEWLDRDAAAQIQSCVDRAWAEPLSPIKLVQEELGEDERIRILLRCVEEAVRAKRCAPLQRAFSQTPIHIFGGHMGANLLSHLPKTTSLHMELPFTEHFSVLQEAECVVMEEPTYWFYPAIGAGCLPFTPPTPELIEELGPNSPIYISDPTELEEKVLFYRQNRDKKEKLLDSMRGHLAKRTWEKQVEKMMRFMDE